MLIFMNLLEIRKNTKLTLLQVANKTGVSKPYVHYCERGKFKPSSGYLMKFAEATGVDELELLASYGYIHPKIKSLITENPSRAYELLSKFEE